MAVTFQFQHSFTLSSRRRLKTLVQRLFDSEGKKLGGLQIVFCDDEYLLDLNKRFLSHDYYTDIITFDLSETDTTEGEIYISVDTARRNAAQYNVLLFNELTRLIVHGCLHLCGYKDKLKAAKEVMTEKEDRYLSLYETL